MFSVLMMLSESLARFLEQFEISYGAIRGFALVTERMREAQAMPEGQHGRQHSRRGQGYLNTSSANKAAAYVRALHRAGADGAGLGREMCRNNDWPASLGGDPQEHQHQPVVNAG